MSVPDEHTTKLIQIFNSFKTALVKKMENEVISFSNGRYWDLLYAAKWRQANSEKFKTSHEKDQDRRREAEVQAKLSRLFPRMPGKDYPEVTITGTEVFIRTAPDRYLHTRTDQFPHLQYVETIINLSDIRSQKEIESYLQTVSKKFAKITTSKDIDWDISIYPISRTMEELISLKLAMLNPQSFAGDSLTVFISDLLKTIVQILIKVSPITTKQQEMVAPILKSMMETREALGTALKKLRSTLGQEIAGLEIPGNYLYRYIGSHNKQSVDFQFISLEEYMKKIRAQIGHIDHCILVLDLLYDQLALGHYFVQIGGLISVLDKYLYEFLAHLDMSGINVLHGVSLFEPQENTARHQAQKLLCLLALANSELMGSGAREADDMMSSPPSLLNTGCYAGMDGDVMTGTSINECWTFIRQKRVFDASRGALYPRVAIEVAESVDAAWMDYYRSTSSCAPASSLMFVPAFDASAVISSTAPESTVPLKVVNT